MSAVGAAVTCVGYALVVLSAPCAMAAAFATNVPRADIASWTFVAFGLGITTAFLAPLLLRAPTTSRHAALRTASRNYLVASALIHLSWELGWLCLYDRLPATAASPWTYAWWLYIDAGDRRYLHAPPDVVAMEWLSVANGLLILSGLWHARLIPVLQSAPRSRSVAKKHEGRLPPASVLALGGAASVHLYSALLYFLGEAVAGLPNCDTSRPLNVAFAFVLANAPWVYMPVVAVFPWLHAELSRSA